MMSMLSGFPFTPIIWPYNNTCIKYDKISSDRVFKLVVICVLEKLKIQFVLFCIERTIILKGNKIAVDTTHRLRFISKLIKKQKNSLLCME